MRPLTAEAFRVRALTAEHLAETYSRAGAVVLARLWRDIAEQLRLASSRAGGSLQVIA